MKKRTPADLLLLEGRISDFAELHIDPQELSDLIAAYGIGVVYKPGIRCPCVRAETAQPRAGCLVCRGLGWAHPEELQQHLPVLLVNRSPHRQVLPIGEWVSDQAWATFPLPVLPGRGDLIAPEGETHIVQQTLVRAELMASNREIQRRAVAPGQRPPRAVPLSEELLYSRPEVEALYWLRNGALRRGREGADFKIRGRFVEWEPGIGPRPGESYSIRYQAPAEYMVAQSAEPIYRSDGGDPYPMRVQVMRLDRWGEPSFQ